MGVGFTTGCALSAYHHSVHAAPDIVESKKPSYFHVKKEDIL
jgi:hypothetical protein